MAVTANTFFDTDFNHFWREKLAPLMKRYGVRPKGFNTNYALIAWVSLDRWSVTCPCGGGEYVWDEGWVMCASCFNEWAYHHFVRTMFPVGRRQIEEVMAFRPRSNRHALIGQTVDELIDENLENGDRVPQWYIPRRPSETPAI